MNTLQLAKLLCAIKVLISPGAWDAEDCQTRAQEFVNAGKNYNIDPLLLVSISIYECDLDAYKDVVYNQSTGIYARDICPTGLRITAANHDHVYQTRGGFSRQEVLNKSAKLLVTYKKYHEKHCKNKHHGYLQHYNTGYGKFDNNYDDQIQGIYYSLKMGRTYNRHLTTRTQEIVRNIRKATGYEIHKDPLRNCKPRSSCVVARR